MAKLIVGCGYVGRRLARYWIERDEVVFASTRSEERADRFRAEGIEPIVFDVTAPLREPLPEVDTVVFAVGFDRTSGDKIHDVYVDGLRRIVEACPGDVSRFIYVSSTGVYGQTDGGWVDEESACKPNRDGGKACLAAEQLLLAHPTLAAKTVILRLAGIYGPARLPQVELLRRGEPLSVAADAWLNLIHVDDVVRIIAAVDRSLEPPATFCVSDGHPVQRGDFYRLLAELLELEEPAFVPPPAGSGRAERARGSKRIRNDRLVSAVNPDLQFPSWREGLAGIVSDLQDR